MAPSRAQVIHIFCCGMVCCAALRVVVWCGVPKALLPNGNSRDALRTGNAKWEGCVYRHVLCVVCCAPVTRQEPSWHAAALVRGRPWDTLLLPLLMQLNVLQCPRDFAP